MKRENMTDKQYQEYVGTYERALQNMKDFINESEADLRLFKSQHIPHYNDYTYKFVILTSIDTEIEIFMPSLVRGHKDFLIGYCMRDRRWDDALISNEHIIEMLEDSLWNMEFEIRKIKKNIEKLSK